MAVNPCSLERGLLAQSAIAGSSAKCRDRGMAYIHSYTQAQEPTCMSLKVVSNLYLVCFYPNVNDISGGDVLKTTAVGAAVEIEG